MPSLSDVAGRPLYLVAAAGLRKILTQPCLAGAIAAEARRRAPEMAWPAVADGYVRLARRLLAERRARLDREDALAAKPSTQTPAQPKKGESSPAGTEDSEHAP